MHPIERLRHVARASGAPAGLLATETANALMSFVGDDAALLTACQRVVSRQPTAAAIAWLCAHVLSAPEPSRALWEAADEIEADRTPQHLIDGLDDEPVVLTLGWPGFVSELLRRRGDVRLLALDTDGWVERSADRASENGHDVTLIPPEGISQAVVDATHVVVDVLAAGPDAALVAQGALAAAVLGRHFERSVWAVAPVGTVLPQKMYAGVTRRWHESDSDPLWWRPVEEMPLDLFDRVATPGGVVAGADAARTTSCPIVPELF